MHLRTRLQRLERTVARRVGRMHDQSAVAPDTPPPAALETDLTAFVQQAWPVIEPYCPLIWGPHLDAICWHLQAVSEGRIANLAIEIPPGSGKSTLTSVLWPVWHWTHRPQTRFITASYSLNLAIRDAVRSRRVLRSAWYQARWGHRFRLTSDQDAKTRYENDQTGYRITASPTAGTTGERGDLTLIDDPHNVMEAESVAVRLATIRWHDEAFYNRLNDFQRGGRVIIGQRVHTQDLIGHVLETGSWTELRIPEEFEEKHRCVTVAVGPNSLPWRDWRTHEGELMRPERMDAAQVAAEKKRLGSFAFAAQHQQRPVPREGALFKADWLKHTFMDFGDAYKVGDCVFAYSDCWHLTIVDPAGGESDSADYTAIGTFAVTPRQDLLVVDMIRERIPPERIAECVLRAATRPGRIASFVGWETGFMQGRYAREASKQEGMPPVKEIDPGGKSKFVRAIPAIVLAEAGQLYLPEDAEWLPEYKKELLVFTGHKDARDDQVDVTSMAVTEREALAVSDAMPFTFGRRR